MLVWDIVLVVNVIVLCVFDDARSLLEMRFFTCVNKGLIKITPVQRTMFL